MPWVAVGTMGSLTNHVDVTSATTDTNLLDNAASCATPIAGQADLTIMKICPATAVAGNPISYTIIVTNRGPSDAQDVVVTDLLPAGVTPVGPVVTNLGVLAARGVTSFMINAMVDAATMGMLTNRADVTSSTTETNTADNTSSCMTLINAEADLAITKSCPATVIAGGPISYTITVTNRGPSDARNVDVSDTLPAGVIPGRGHNQPRHIGRWGEHDFRDQCRRGCFHYGRTRQ